MGSAAVKKVISRIFVPLCFITLIWILVAILAVSGAALSDPVIDTWQNNVRLAWWLLRPLVALWVLWSLAALLCRYIASRMDAPD
jgi:hypothetical protein